MDEVIWVEILSRHGEVLARHRCAGADVRLGRDYSNDVILDDPSVAGRHVRIARDARGLLIAEALAGAGGIHAGSDRTPVERVFLDGDRPIRVGHTYVRVRDATYVFLPERRAAPRRRWWPLEVALGAAVLGLAALAMWLAETAEPKPYRYAQQLVVLTFCAAVWTTLWAIVSRVFTGRARFEPNLVIALSGLLAYALYGSLVTLAAYAFSWSTLIAYQYVGLWLILGAVCFAHLREIGPSRLELKGAVVAALMAVALLMQTLGRSESSSEAYSQPTVVRRLLPPAFRLSPLQSEAGFFADVERLKEQLDRARAETPAGASSSGGGLAGRLSDCAGPRCGGRRSR
ncbi:MAG TPA: FHA domain-containing protein [Candidatus Sulfotelmatobacter sp.]|nr:FHA domain-containing protein [Candidatus Sulfotelmatobacter sp.]